MFTLFTIKSKSPSLSKSPYAAPLEKPAVFNPLFSLLNVKFPLFMYAWFFTLFEGIISISFLKSTLLSITSDCSTSSLETYRK